MNSRIPNSYQYRTNGLRYGVLCTIAFVQIAFGARANDESVLILSSDMAVEKYLTAQTAFKNEIKIPTSEIDLGRKWSDDSKIAALIREKDPDLIYCIGSKAYLIAYKLAKDSNIVVTSAINWQRFPLGQKTYGIANELPTEMQLTMFRYFFPDLKRIGVLYSKKYNKEWLELAEADGKDVGVEIVGKAVKRSKDIDRILADLLPKVDAIWITSDPIVLSGTKAVSTIFNQSNAQKKPVIAYDSAFAEFGAVMMISPDIATIGRQAAGLSLELLGTGAISDRFQNPVGSEITVNLDKIEEFGVLFNKDALDSVNRIIK